MPGQTSAYQFQTQGLQRLKKDHFDQINQLVSKKTVDSMTVALHLQIIPLQLAKWAKEIPVNQPNTNAIKKDIEEGYKQLFKLLASKKLAQIPFGPGLIVDALNTLNETLNKPGSQVRPYCPIKKQLRLEHKALVHFKNNYGAECLLNNQYPESSDLPAPATPSLLNDFLAHCSESMQCDQNHALFIQAATLQLDLLQQLPTLRLNNTQNGSEFTAEDMARDILKHLERRIEREQDPSEKAKLKNEYNALYARHLPETDLLQCEQDSRALAEDSNVDFNAFLNRVEGYMGHLIETPEGGESFYNEHQLALIKNIVEITLGKFDAYAQRRHTSLHRMQVASRINNIIDQAYAALPDDADHELVVQLDIEMHQNTSATAKHAIERAAVSKNPRFVSNEQFEKFLNNNRRDNNPPEQAKTKIELFKFKALRILAKAEANYVGSVKHAVGGRYKQLMINGQKVESRLTTHAANVINTILDFKQGSVSGLAKSIQQAFTDFDPKKDNPSLSARKEATHDAYKELLKLCNDEQPQITPGSATPVRDQVKVTVSRTADQTHPQSPA